VNVSGLDTDVMSHASCRTNNDKKEISMAFSSTSFFQLIVALLVGSAVSMPVAFAQKSAAMVINRLDADGDGKVSRKEWRKKRIFDEVDLDNDGYISRQELKIRFGEAETDGDALQSSPGDRPDPITMAAIRRGKFDDVAHLKARGLFETGLKPVWGKGVECRDIDHWYAKDYSDVRPKEAYHGGVDIPAPFGTPVLAAMSGEVVALYEGKRSPRGIEVVLRHTPEQSGLPYYLYSRYTHFETMPKLTMGQQVKMGEVLGTTGNTGVLGCELKGIPCRGSRRPVLHFDILYTKSEKYFDTGAILVPFEAHWMDPNALYRKQLPLDSQSMLTLPAAEKRVPISYMLESGEFVPADTRMIWPYSCRTSS
jgi:murein DD-endopeptidase MepM/ murein hydrolase activator NlpD